MKSKVYIKADKNNLIIRCEGGFSEPKDLTGWLCIDEGEGDKYFLCQSQYFDGGLYTYGGVPRWKLENTTPVLRSEYSVKLKVKPKL